MQRSPELEAMLAGDEVAVRDSRARRKHLLGGTALLLGGAVLSLIHI